MATADGGHRLWGRGLTMGGPVALSDIFAAVMLGAAAYSAASLVVGFHRGRNLRGDIDAFHVLMATAMAGTLVPALAVLGRGAWEVVFGTATAWFTWTGARSLTRAGRGPSFERVPQPSHGVVHPVMGSAMLYMYLAPGGVSVTMAAVTGTDVARAPAGAEWAPMLFLVVLLASAVLSLDRASRFARMQPVTVRTVPVPSGVRAPGASERRGELSVGGRHPRSAHGRGGLAAPRLEAGCHLAMCLAMGYALLVMR